VLRRRRADDSFEVVYTCDEFPGVQKVALEILPKFP
jgi:spore germination protein GerM